MIKRSAAAAVLLLGLSSAAHALEFQPLGAGSLGVGGAGVARNFGAMSPYWNPAGLAFAPKTVTVSITGAVGVEPRGRLAQDLDNLDKANNAFATPTDATANALANAVNDLIATTGKDNLRVTAGAALGVQVKHFGFGVFGSFEGGAIPNQGGIPIITPVTAATFDQNNVNAALNSKTVGVRGLAVFEAPLAYGHAFDLGGAGKLGVGAAAKYLRGYATSKLNQQVFDVANNSVVSSSDLTNDLKKNFSDSSDWGIDLGLLWKPSAKTSLGVVAKNLNSPSFTTKSGDKLTMGRQVRAGFAVDPLSWLELTADIDVLSNSTLIPGLKSQNLGGGVEFHPFSSLKLRAGGYTNLAASSNGAVTAGLSLGIPWFFIDIDGAYGLGEVKYNNDTYPSEAKAQVSMNFAF